jgi:hypothetical protein
MSKKERAEFIDREADAMARSGKYADWLSIEHALRHQGYPEARQVLDDQFRRKELNEMCHQARESNTAPGNGGS